MRREDRPISVDPKLFFQMLSQVSDGTNATTANFAEKLAERLDPDEGPIIIEQGPPTIKSAPLTPGQQSRRYRLPRTPSGSHQQNAGADGFGS